MSDKYSSLDPFILHEQSYSRIQGPDYVCIYFRMTVFNGLMIYLY